MTANHIARSQSFIHDKFAATVHTGHLHQGRLRFAVYYLIYISLILYFERSSLRNHQSSRFLYRNHYVTRTAAVQQSVLIRENGTQANSTRRTVNDSADRLDLSLFGISRFIVQLQVDGRHTFQRLVFRAILANQSQQLVFRHREVDVHVRIVGNGGQRFGNAGTHQRTYAIRQCTYHSVCRTLHYRIRKVITGAHFLCLGLCQLGFGSQKRIFCRTQIESGNYILLIQFLFAVVSQLCRCQRRFG